ncbi:MAG: hypothetical protein ACO1PZ_08960 [Gammaproteobacteria bacterium]
MRFIDMVRRSAIATLASCLALLVQIGSAGAAETGAPRNPELEAPEEISVLGRRGRLALRAEIVRLETRMFDIFNSLNDTREFEIYCAESIVTGSRIAERECVPTYVKQARMRGAQQFMFFDLVPPNGENSSGPPRNGGARSMNTRGAPQMTEEQLWFHDNDKHAAFNARFRALAAQHPELAAVAQDLQAKRLELVEAEERRRKESVVGRFFSLFSGGDDE